MSFAKSVDAPVESKSLPTTAQRSAAAFSGTMVIVLALGNFSFFYQPDMAIRFAVLPVIVAVGLPYLVRLLRSGRRGEAIAAAGFCLWAGLSTAVSAHPWQSFWGLAFLGPSLVMILALAGAWAFGACAQERSRLAIHSTLLVAVAVNAVAGLSQVLTGSFLWLSSAPYGRRSVGFFGNPIPESQLLIGGFWLFACKIWPQSPESRTDAGAVGQSASRTQRPTYLWVAATTLVVAALFDTGSRQMLPLLLMCVVAMGFLRGFTQGAGLALIVVLGIGIGAMAASFSPGSLTSASRLAGQGTLGLSTRLSLWDTALHSLEHRPLTGVGPGRFIAASSPKMSLGTARYAFGQSEFSDAHNIVVEYTTTTGLIGILLMAVWLALCFRRAGWRQPLAGFAIVVMSTQFLELQNPGVTTLMFLALGASSPVLSSTAIPKSRSSRTNMSISVASRSILIALGIMTTCSLLAGSFFLRQSLTGLTQSTTLSSGKTALHLLPPWPVTDNAMAQAYIVYQPYGGQPKQFATEEYWYTRAIDQDPTLSSSWVALGNDQLRRGYPVCALNSFHHALDDFDWSANALSGQYRGEILLGQYSQSVQTLAKLRAVDPHYVRPTIVEQSDVKSVQQLSCPT